MYTTTTVVSSCRNDDDDDAGRGSRPRAPCIDRQASRQFDAYIPPIAQGFIFPAFVYCVLLLINKYHNMITILL